MPVALEHFVKQLADSGVIAPGKLECFVPPKAQPKDAQELARLLVQSKCLTKFQAQEIYSGRAKSLILGNYTLVDKIGAGGMGQVYKAEHRRMHRIVAIKVLPPGVMTDPVAAARFQREVEAAAKLSHPNIVTAHDADESRGVHFLVMECVEGADLSALVKKNGPLSVTKALNYTLQAARGLEFAHKHGVIHRDIKPANLLVNPEGVLKILDMGLARIAGGDAETQAELTGTGAVMGTVDYMAPEQALSTKHADARADIYSLGCTLYYLVSGKAAYHGDTLMAKLLAHRVKPIPSLGPEASDELQAVFEKMVAKSVDDRYQTMSEVIAELEVVSGFSSGRSAMAAKSESSRGTLEFLREDARLGTLIKQKKAAAGETKPSISGQESGTKILGKIKRAVATNSRKPLVLVGLALCLVLLLGIALTLIPRHGTLAVEKVKVTLKPPLPAVAPFDSKQARKFQESWASYLGVPVEMTNAIGMKLVLIPPGEFEMGSANGQANEKPAHEVSITRPFYLGKYKVTVAQFRQFVEATKYQTEPEKYNNGWAFAGGTWGPVAGVNWRSPNVSQQEDHPVSVVAWKDVEEFCAWASKQTGSRVYLPTEAQWEYACRAGTTTRFNTGDSDEDLYQAGWTIHDSGLRKHPVGQKKPNAWALYDMHGNVFEMIQDYFSADYYAESPIADPEGSPKGHDRMIRGGGLGNAPDECSSAARHPIEPQAATGNGFRVAVEIIIRPDGTAESRDLKN